MTREVLVETGLNETVEWPKETVTRHARTRFVERKKPEKPPLPEVGDRWEPLTVRARLERMGETYRRLPHSPDTKPGGYKSCMPTPVREPWKDAAPSTLRQGVSEKDLQASNLIIDVLGSDERAVAWAIANRMGDRELGRHRRCHHATAAREKQRVLDVLAAHWNTLSMRPDADDVLRARRFVHRNFD